MIKIAALTRGFDFDNDFKWKADWPGLGFADRISDKPIRELLDSYALKDCVRTEDPGVVISRKDTLFGVLLSGFATDYKAARPGPITVSFAFFELEERVARSLAVRILRDWKNVSEKLVSFILRHAPPASDLEWSIDVKGLLQYVESVIAAEPTPEGSLSSSRRSRPYTKPGDPEFPKLADLVAEQSFSLGNGSKVVIGKPFSGIREESLLLDADLVVLPSLSVSDDLEPKKKWLEPKNHTQSPRSNTSATNFSDNPRGSATAWRNWMRSNGILLIAFAIAALVAFDIVQCVKKKLLKRRHRH